MLADTPRKVLRILANRNVIPSVEQLARLAGRKPEQIRMALRVLAVGGFIQWDSERHHALKVLKAWEGKPPLLEEERAAENQRMIEWELFPGMIHR